MAYLLAALLVGATALLISLPSVQAQSRPTLAIITPDDDSRNFVEPLQKEFLQQGFSLPEPSYIETVTKALVLNNLFNLTTDEARGLGQALSVDCYLIMRARTFERADVGAKLSTECYLAIALVNTRRGELVLFDYLEAKQATKALTLTKLATDLLANVPKYSEQLKNSITKNLQAIELNKLDSEAITETTAGTGKFKAPAITARQQPPYTELARKNEVTATVDLEVVLRKDGRVGQITILRWAGFGLDESAQQAIQQLKFRPATLDGQPVSYRALIRYNFNYKTQP